MNMQKFRKFGVLYCTLLAVLYVSCSAQTPNYQKNLTLTGNWVVSSASSLPDGAIIFTSDKIDPYFSNLAAIGLTKNKTYYAQVKKWMQSDIAHLNYPDKCGLYSTIAYYTGTGTTYIHL